MTTTGSRTRDLARILPVALAGAILCSTVPTHAASTLEDIQEAIDKGCLWLSQHQNPDGGYGPFPAGRVKDASDVGITAFVVNAFARSTRAYRDPDGPFVSKAVTLILSLQQADGAFYDPRDPTLQNYRTSVVIMALSALDPARHSAAIRRAQDFVKAQQLTESRGYEESTHVPYGAITYGGNLRGDLSNSSFAAEALATSGLSGGDELWKRLAVYVSRCQNAETVAPILAKNGIGTTKDGGFRYAPDDTRGSVETLDDGTKLFSSYGSMTYAGLKSLLHAQVAKDDPRLKQAIAWISRNFTVKENPGMATVANPKAGQQGLFYYYHTMAKALAVYGEPVIRDAKGIGHTWAKELADHLLAIRKADGSWQGESDKWWENLPALDTAYAVIALSECEAALKKAQGTKAPN